MERGDPVSFNGVEFRSIAEARFACFLSELGIDYTYEPVVSDHYLVDFAIPDIGYVEIKFGRFPTPEECAKAYNLHIKTGRRVYIFFNGLSPNSIRSGNALGYINGKASLQQFFSECPACRRIDVTHLGNTRGHRCGCVLAFGQIDGRTPAIYHAASVAESKKGFRSTSSTSSTAAVLPPRNVKRKRS